MKRSSLMKSLVPAVGVLAVSVALLAAEGQPVAEALKRPALIASKPQQAVLLGGAVAGSRIVVVGERGLVLVSDDAGASWAQQSVPVSNTLTAVRFADDKHGVAVGHAGTVLITEDGGSAWSVALDGREAAAVVSRAASGDSDARRLVDDGPDKPFLDVLLDGPGQIVAVGAYGLILASNDGGRSWESWMDRLDNSGGLYCYAIRRRGDEIVIAGEQGLLLRSSDAGKTFRRMETPYKGSFFTLELPAERDIVVAGLRGNAWRSRDEGRSWTRIDNDAESSITSSLQLADGTLLLGDQAGRVLRLEGDALSPLGSDGLPPVNGLVAAAAEKQKFALTLQGVVPLR